MHATVTKKGISNKPGSGKIKGEEMLKRAELLMKKQVEAADGKAGICEDLLFDDHSWTVRYILIRTEGWLTGREVLIHPKAVRALPVQGKEPLKLNLSREQVRESPPVDSREPVSRQKEEQLLSYYGLPVYWGEGPYGGMLPEGIPVAGGRKKRHEKRHDIRSAKELRGYHLDAAEGAAGSVSDILFDIHSWKIKYFEIDTGTILHHKKTLISVSWVKDISWEETALKAPGISIREIEVSPPYDPEGDMGEEQEKRLREHYEKNTELSEGE
jgi:uncharacterized protein YrrD